MKDLLNLPFNDINNIEIAINNMHKRGVRALIFSERELSSGETEDFFKVYKRLKGHPMS